MGLDQDASSNNSGLPLILGLALTLSQQETITPPPSNKITKPFNNSSNFITCSTSNNHNNNLQAELPSLTLGLSYPKNVNNNKVYYEDPLDFSTQTSPHHSVVSSFSSGRVKRERDVSSEEVEAIERVCSRVSDEEEDAVAARKKLRLTKDQSAMLEENFKQHSTLNPVFNHIL